MLSLLGSMCTPAFAEAEVPNGLDAVAYSDRWAKGRNPAYHGYVGTDCTNFVSQAMSAGGMRLIYGSTYYSWFPSSSLRNWNTVVDFIDTFRYWQRGKIITPWPADANYTPAKPGDIYAYDWGRGDGISHMSHAAGFGQRAPEYAADGMGDFINQHSYDRYHAPWNYGFLHPIALSTLPICISIG